MATWGEVRDCFLERFGVKHDRADWFGVVIEGALVRVESVAVQDEPWVLLLSLVCYEEDLPHRDALARNLRIAVGALALNGQQYELRQAVALGSADARSLTDLAIDLAREATRLAHAVDARAQAAALLTAYSE